MTSRVCPRIALALLLLTAGAGAAETRTLGGEYRWNQGSEGDLEAVFTATGPDEWKVAFHFRFRGRKHVYRGTAEGSLSAGKLAGTVRNESERRTFTFRGEFENGRFRGTHAETTGGGERRTGTLRLSERPPATVLR